MTNEQDDGMLLTNELEQAGTVINIHGLHSRATYPAPIARPRIDLQTGLLAGQSAQWPGARPVEVLAAACALAVESGALVSIPAPAPPAALLGPLRAALAATNLSPNRLEFTFRAAMLDDAGVELLLALSALRDENVGLALENFGCGGIALAAHLPLSSVILAPASIAGIPGAPPALALLHAIIDLAHANDMSVIAAGIDTESQRAVLSGLGCDFGEGLLFGSATPHARADPKPA